MPKMKIYDVDGWPNPLRVRMALKEKNAYEDATFHHVDVMGLEHRTPAFLAKNPDAGVPYMELEDGTCISQCNAIIAYINAAYGGVNLAGDTPQETAQITMMNARAENGLLNAAGTYFHHATKGLGPEIEVWQCKEWGEKQKEVALSTMEKFDKLLMERAYLAGDRFSFADITAYAGMIFSGFAKIDVPDGLRALMDWKEKIAARPSLAA